MNNQFEVINCPFCQSANGKTWASENGFDLTKCDSCGFLYIQKRPNNSLIKESVQQGIHSYLGNQRSKVTKRIAFKINMYESIFKELLQDVWAKKQPIKWLDVGAGFGEITQAVTNLAEQGSLIKGIEPMKPKVEVAVGLGLNVQQGFLSDVEEKFDFISFINVFSHIDDINLFFKQCNQRLNDFGEMIIETGNIADLANVKDVPSELDLPDHLMFAGKKHIEGFLVKYGFEVIAIKEFRRDGIMNFVKCIVKKIMGRQTNIVIPFTSQYRTMIFRAKKKTNI